MSRYKVKKTMYIGGKKFPRGRVLNLSPKQAERFRSFVTKKKDK